jgi:4-hydroxy-tetrahydrodipicolinate synthase
MTERFHGTGVALATPMQPGGEIDFGGLGRLVEHVLSGGVDYLVVLGTTGESPVFNWQEKLQILDHVIAVNAGRKPVVFGYGGNNTGDMLAKLPDLSGKSIDALLSASPYYNKPSQEGIYQHYKALADASPFPVILYNVPHRTSSNVSAQTTLRLASHPNILAIKEAANDMHQCSVIARDKPAGFLLISGDDMHTLPILSVGGVGVISVIANAYPRMFSDMVRHYLSGNTAKATALHLQLVHAIELSVEEGNPASVKAALEHLGICTREVRLPLVAASDALKGKFAELKLG